MELRARGYEDVDFIKLAQNWVSGSIYTVMSLRLP